MDVEKKRMVEKKTVQEMIRLYCHGKHHTHGQELCQECEYIAAYAAEKLQQCPRMDIKTFCSQCPIHCYGKSERERIQEIMRYAGPRMLLHHPMMTMHHMLLDWQTRRGIRQQEAVVSKKKQGGQ